MKNEKSWQQSKYALVGQNLVASRSTADLDIASRLITDLVAYHYDLALRQYCSGDLLDLGCGRAPLYVLYRDFSDSITCVDWGKSLHDIGHADVLCDLNRPIPLPNASFDTVILSDVLEHIYHPQELLAEVRRMLRPGGKLIMNVPFLYWLHEQPYDYFRYTRFSLERMIADCELSVVEMEELGGAPEVFADLVAKTVAHTRYMGQYIARFVQWSCFKFVQTRIGRGISESTSARFPLGYFLVATLNESA